MRCMGIPRIVIVVGPAYEIKTNLTIEDFTHTVYQKLWVNIYQIFYPVFLRYSVLFISYTSLSRLYDLIPGRVNFEHTVIRSQRKLYLTHHCEAAILVIIPTAKAGQKCMFLKFTARAKF